MGKFIGLNDQEWAVVEPFIPYKWGITFRGKQPLLKKNQRMVKTNYFPKG